MLRRDLLANFNQFLRLQTLCAGIILASWGIFWAVNEPVTNIRDLFIYVLIQINLTVLLLGPLKFLYEEQRFPYYWPAHVTVIVVISALVVVISTAAVYRADGLHGHFLLFLRRGWKFPVVANLVFSSAYEIYKVTTWRLRGHNRQLQQAIQHETAEREVEAEELKQAQEIQRGLLPKQIPQLQGFQITGAWEPAHLVGGDYYDVIQLSKDKLGICIADVVGKGVSAALLMANVQASVRAFASETASPAYVCSRINSVLCTNIACGKFVTLFYGVLDATAMTLRYTNAGHPRPIVIEDNGTVRYLENGGALLGVFPDWKYEDSIVELCKGELVLLFTDGITEAVSPEGKEFGEQRLLEAAIGSQELRLYDLQVHILEQVKRFCHNRMSDDATLILVSGLRVGVEENRALPAVQSELAALASSDT